MGTFNTQGSLCGKIGTVVAASWNGIEYIRSLPQHFKDKKSKRQLCQRSKFAMVFRVLQSMTDYLRVGFKPIAYHQSAFNAAMSHNLHNMPVDHNGKVELDFSRMRVSSGRLLNAYYMKAVRQYGKIVATWTDNTGVGATKRDDRARLLVHDIEKGLSITAEVRRDAELVELALPDSWASDKLAIYLSFASADGKDVSISQYLGTVKAFKINENAEYSLHISFDEKLPSNTPIKPTPSPSAIPKGKWH